MNSTGVLSEWILQHIKENKRKNAKHMLEIENRQKRIRFIYEFINQKMLVSILLYLCDRYYGCLLFIFIHYKFFLVN